MIVQTGRQHLNWVANNMRLYDQEEVWAATHSSPAQALTNAWRASQWCFTILAPDKKPMAVYGVAPTHTEVGVPWLLGTDDVKKHARYFLSITPGIVDEMLQYRPALANFVDARNTGSIRWLKWLGFEFADEPQTYGREGLPFYLFWRNV